MEQLQVRILIAYVDNGVIAYLYNRESFDLLKVKKQTYDNSQFISIGDTIEYADKKYLVKNINFKMFEELYQPDNTKGINAYSPTDLSDFNCQIGVFVENA